MFKRAVKKVAKYFETLLQLAPSCGSLADSCRSGELNSVSIVFVQYGPFIYEKGAKCVLKLYVCKQRQEREQRSLLKLIELKRNSRSGKSVLRASFASKWCEQVCLEAYLLGGSLHT